MQVAESGSFAGAGRILGISASAVGKSISRLEERVGVRLFQRSSRSLRLTPEGARFVERCRRILAEIQEAEAELSETVGAPRGVLRISVPLARGPFHSVLSDFRTAYPSIDLEVESSNRSVDLVREGFDAAIRSGALQDSSLKARDLGTFRLILVASPKYLSRRGTPQHPRDLEAHDRLRLRLPNTGGLQPLGFRGAALEEAASTRAALVANSLDVLIHFAVRGHGIAHVADLLVRDELDEGKLVQVLADEVGESIPMHLVWVSGKHTPPKLRAFIDFVARRFKQR